MESPSRGNDVSGGSLFEEYYEGQIITLSVLSGVESDITSSHITVKIVQLLVKRTLSCPMVVDILDHGYEQRRVFLKLFDRRFSDQARDDCSAVRWNQGLEDEYVRVVEDGTVGRFLHELRNLESYTDTSNLELKPEEAEGYLASALLGYHRAEVAVYGALREIQGRQIPRFLASVDLDLTPPNVQSREDEGIEHFHVKGILLEFIDGFQLGSLPYYAPRSTWQPIFDEAVSIIHVISDYNILNMDVRPENFMITEVEDGHYRVIMIDLALCRIRAPGETDAEWGLAKLEENEEGGIAFWMKNILRDQGFALRFRHSQRYREWDPDSEA